MVETEDVGPEITQENISKSELKARKAMAKLGLKAVPEINRVVIRRQNNTLFVVAKPEVYKTANNETHIVFGAAKTEDLAAQQAAAQRIMGQPSQATTTEAAEEEEEEAEGEEGVESADIEMVMAEANVSRAKAVRALKVNFS
jgi:nascent polypeptide-associated complex subunit alpha